MVNTRTKNTCKQRSHPTTSPLETSNQFSAISSEQLEEEDAVEISLLGENEIDFTSEQGTKETSQLKKNNYDHTAEELDAPQPPDQLPSSQPAKSKSKRGRPPKTQGCPWLRKRSEVQDGIMNNQQQPTQEKNETHQSETKVLSQTAQNNNLSETTNQNISQSQQPKAREQTETDKFIQKKEQEISRSQPPPSSVQSQELHSKSATSNPLHHNPKQNVQCRDSATRTVKFTDNGGVKVRLDKQGETLAQSQQHKAKQSETVTSIQEKDQEISQSQSLPSQVQIQEISSKSVPNNPPHPNPQQNVQGQDSATRTVKFTDNGGVKVSLDKQGKTFGLKPQILQKRIADKKTSILNLSKERKLTSDEISVLDLGLTFCPSVEHFNKEQLADDVYKFIRQLSLREYFCNEDGERENIQASQEHSDRAPTKWSLSDSSWYPESVRESRSDSLKSFITEFLAGVKANLRINSGRLYNNLTPRQRDALTSLATDKSIIIKQSDKCGTVVIMDTEDYDAACLEQLEDKNFYEELQNDPNAGYKDQIVKELNQLLLEDSISEKELSVLKEGTQTPAFYGLPKIHSVKSTDRFPPLRPICSGSASCTKRLSEFLDSFLKPLAQKIPSYIQDTTDFLLKISNYKSAHVNKTILATLDVNALYPNIDQEEGVNACHEYLEKRSEKSVSSKVLRRLILLVLKCNTLIFKNRFFHQVCGTAMGTPLAVNFANLFMAKFEQQLLHEYERLHKERPAVWIRFIDDIFIIWEGNMDGLNKFIKFANCFAKENGYKSSITFKHATSTTTVNFLDTTISLQPDGTLASTLYNKPTASHQYLHQKSYHASHAKNSLPKSQFIRIRRICSSLEEFDKHAEKYVNHFVRRNYSRKHVIQHYNTVRSMNRDSLLNYRQATEDTARIPLVLTYNHKFSGIGRVLLDVYKRTALQHNNFRKIFPSVPFVAYRRTKNLRERLVRANHHGKSGCGTNNNMDSGPTRSLIEPQMNTSGLITNSRARRSARIAGGPANTIGCIYAAECTKHDLLYVGQTGGRLNVRFNGHRSDTSLRPERCELDQHFAEGNCNINKDLRVSVLENAKGTSDSFREYKEDRWITRLQTNKPAGLNVSSHEFGQIYRALYEK